MSVQVHDGRQSNSSDDELAPVAEDLLQRLSLAHSTISALESEVDSLRAQNALLRQQVERQQALLDAGWAGEGTGLLDACAEDVLEMCEA